MTVVVATGPWNVESAYAVNDIATFAGEDWIALQQMFTGQGILPSESLLWWAPYGPNTTYLNLGDWRYGVTYHAGDIVNNLNASSPPWQAQSTTTQNPFFPVTGPVPSPVAWSASVPQWNVGDLVIDYPADGNNLHDCIDSMAGGTGSNPMTWGDDTVLCTAANWKGAWTAGVTYTAGNTVYLPAEETLSSGWSINTYVANGTNVNTAPAWTSVSNDGTWTKGTRLALPWVTSAWQPATINAWGSGFNYGQGEYAFIDGFYYISVVSISSGFFDPSENDWWRLAGG
jgi:hypothetical protein